MIRLPTLLFLISLTLPVPGLSTPISDAKYNASHPVLLFTRAWVPVLAAKVQDGGPAEVAGIRPGDVILAFDGVELDDRRHLSRVVADTAADKRVDVLLLRDGEQLTLRVTVGRLVEPRFARSEPPSHYPAAQLLPRVGRAR